MFGFGSGEKPPQADAELEGEESEDPSRRSFIAGAAVASVMATSAGEALAQVESMNGRRVVVGPDVELAEGMTEQVQTILFKTDFYTGKIDGVYGDGTEAAVEQFQRQVMKPEDRENIVYGSVDDRTWEYLFNEPCRH